MEKTNSFEANSIEHINKVFLSQIARCTLGERTTPKPCHTAVRHSNASLKWDN